jgi:hypothetical protein
VKEGVNEKEAVVGQKKVKQFIHVNGEMVIKN